MEWPVSLVNFGGKLWWHQYEWTVSIELHVAKHEVQLAKLLPISCQLCLVPGPDRSRKFDTTCSHCPPYLTQVPRRNANPDPIDPLSAAGQRQEAAPSIPHYL
jgi:hypothetical protein